MVVKVPVAMLESVHATLRAASEQTRALADSRKGQRGNPALREQARQDARVARHLYTHMVMRRAVLGSRRHSWEDPGPNASPERRRSDDERRLHRHAVENMPDLGLDQWRFIARIGRWTGSVPELLDVVRSVVKDLQPPPAVRSAQL